MNSISKRAISSMWHDRRLARITQRPTKIAPSGLEDRSNFRSLPTMTEFDQSKEPQDSSLEQVTSPQDPVMNTIAQKTAFKKESSSETTTPTNDDTVSETTKAPYETIQQGPITYFRYYYEDVEQPAYFTPDTAEAPTSRNLLPFYLAGGSVLGATLISGIVIASLANNSKSQSPQNTTQPEVKETPKPKKTPPQVAPPEVIPQSRSTPARSRQKPKDAPPKKSSAAPVQSSSELLVQQSLSLSDPLPVPTVPVIRQPLTGASKQPLATNSKRPLADNLKGLLPKSSPALPALTASPLTPPASLPTPSLPPTLSNETFAPTSAIAASSSQPTTDARCVSPQVKADPSSATNNQRFPDRASRPVSELVMGAIATSSKAEIAGDAQLKAAQTIDPSLSDADKELQAFLDLPQKFPTSAGIAVLPLPCDIAQTAIDKPQVGEFTVLKLDPQNYQKRWKTSSKNPQALTPIYGFVDYKQQSIVLLARQSIESRPRD
ncbi:hypothetical protein ACKFKF_30695 [Phormidesmis sp. 146-12]